MSESLDGEGWGGWDARKLSERTKHYLAPFTAEVRAQRLAGLLAELIAASPASGSTGAPDEPKS